MYDETVRSDVRPRNTTVGGEGFQRSPMLRKPSKVSGRQHGRLLAVVLGSHVLPLLMAVYFCINLHMAIMPIMGRVGTLDNPEVSVAVISGFLAIAITSFMTPYILLVCDNWGLGLLQVRCLTLLIQVSRNGRLPVIFLAALSALSILFAVSPLGFPFSAAPGSACPQRMLIFNVERTFHNQQMKQTHSDTGIWVVPLDFNGPRSVRAHMSKGRKVHHVDCSQHVYCGMPYYFPVISKLRESYYIEAAGPIFHAKRKFELISQKMVLPNVRRLNLRLSGSRDPPPRSRDLPDDVIVTDDVTGIRIVIVIITDDVISDVTDDFTGIRIVMVIITDDVISDVTDDVTGIRIVIITDDVISDVTDDVTDIRIVIVIVADDVI
ncbi:endoplasmic reticulum metallopeptidase 1 [Ixodes scapularis]